VNYSYVPPHPGRGYPAGGNCAWLYSRIFILLQRHRPVSPALRADIIGTKLNPYHVGYLTSHRSERLSINRQRSSAVLIDNPRAKYIKGRTRWAQGWLRWRQGRVVGMRERARMFASDGLVSASTYNILCRSISAIPFSLSMRLATLRAS